MKKKSKNILIGISLVVVLLVGMFFAFGGTLQSILSSPTKVNLVNGEAFWVATAVSGSVDEGFTFRYGSSNTRDYTLPDGTEVQPQKDMSISFSKGKSVCNYGIVQTSTPVFLGPVKVGNFQFWELNNPSKEVEVIVRDSNGKSETLNGAVFNDQVTLRDPDGDGEVTVQSQGLLSTVTSCPGGSDVAIYVDKDGFTRLVRLSTMENMITNNDAISMLFLRKRLDNNLADFTGFTNGFDQYPDYNPLQGYLRGNMDIGNPVITITADAGYFDSVFYSPPKETNPKIYDVEHQGEAKVGSNSGVIVKLKNLDEGVGNVVVSATTDNCGLSPTSKTVILDRFVDVPFFISHGTGESTCKIDFEACSTNQFGSNVCDRETIRIDQTEDDPPTFCGDGSCQPNENNATCPADCKEGNDDRESCEDKAEAQPFLGWTYDETTKTNIFGKTTTEGKCKAKFLPWYIAFSVILLLGIITVLRLTSKKKKREKK